MYASNQYHFQISKRNDEDLETDIDDTGTNA